MFHPDFLNSPNLAPFEEIMLNSRGPRRRFDEYYRCYPVAMLPGPERDNVNHGGKVIMPPSALDKLTRLHITYPMLFELINGAKERMTHAGVLEFIAEEGKIYLPYWIMQTLLLEPGDLLQIKSTDLPPGTFIKLQPQSVAFLEISDPKAVLENAMRNFSCLTKGDVFSFSYNDSIYSIEVLETKPGGEGTKSAISVLETDLEVDFAPPVGYVEPSRSISGTSTPRSMGTGASTLRGESGMLHNTGTMAQAINYSSIAPSANSAAKGSRAAGSNFLTAGQKLSSKKGAKPLTPKASTPVAGASTNKAEDAAHPRRKTNGPQPLRLPPGKLFFGYEIKPVKGKNGDPTAAGTTEEQQTKESRFAGQGMSLRPGGIKRKGDGGGEMDIDSKPPAPPPPPSAPGGERKGGRTLRDLS